MLRIDADQRADEVHGGRDQVTVSRVADAEIRMAIATRDVKLTRFGDVAPQAFCRRLDRCRGHARHIPLSSVARWLNWSALAAIRLTLPATFEPTCTIDLPLAWRWWIAQEGRREEKGPGLAAAERDELARLQS